MPRRSDIPDYFTDEFAHLLTAWSSIKKWGMPYSGGWAEQPCRLMDVMGEFERLYAEWEHDDN